MKIKAQNRILTAGLSLIPYLMAAAPAFAAWPPTDPYAGKTLCGIIGTLADILFGLAIAIATIFLILAGYQYMSSGGDKMAVANSRDKITSSVVGMVIATAAYFILTIVVEKVLEVILPGCDI